MSKSLVISLAWRIRKLVSFLPKHASINPQYSTSSFNSYSDSTTVSGLLKIQFSINCLKTAVNNIGRFPCLRSGRPKIICSGQLKGLITWARAGPLCRNSRMSVKHISFTIAWQPGQPGWPGSRQGNIAIPANRAEFFTMSSRSSTQPS